MTSHVSTHRPQRCSDYRKEYHTAYCAGQHSCDDCRHQWPAQPPKHPTNSCHVHKHEQPYYACPQTTVEQTQHQKCGILCGPEQPQHTTKQRPHGSGSRPSREPEYPPVRNVSALNRCYIRIKRRRILLVVWPIKRVIGRLRSRRNAKFVFGLRFNRIHYPSNPIIADWKC